MNEQELNKLAAKVLKAILNAHTEAQPELLPNFPSNAIFSEFSDREEAVLPQSIEYAILKSNFEDIALAYAEAFAKKHSIDFEGWVANRAGEVAYYNDYTVHFDDIRYSIDEDLPPDSFFQYLDSPEKSAKTLRMFHNMQKIEASKKVQQK